MRVFVGLAFVSQLLVGAELPVIEAVGKGHAVGREQAGVDAVRAALAAGGDVNERDKAGWTPLMYAALECRPQILTLLLDSGAKADARALVIASGCFIARVRMKLAPGRGMPPSYVESERVAPVTMVRALLAHGADVNGADSDGRTPLMMAAMQGWADVIRELLGARAAVNARDRAGRLAMDYADPGDREIVGLLEGAKSLRASGVSGRTVCDAERALDRLGYDTSIMDCIAGQQLRNAVTKFQTDRALPVTGELDAATRKALAIR